MELDYIKANNVKTTYSLDMKIIAITSNNTPSSYEQLFTDITK